MTKKYASGDARAWALEHLRGVCGCVMPSFTPDLGDLNEAAIRHDVAHELELGFTGLLIVAECGTTREELKRIIRICVDEAGDAVTIIQVAEDTLEQNVELVKYAAEAGVDLVMPSYPLSFYPTAGADIVDYTRAIAEASHLGVIIFAMNLWNFERLHPSGFAVEWLDELVEKVPNIAGIKNEVGGPGVSGVAEVFRRYSGRVVVSDPLEMNAPTWTSTYGMPWMGTSNYEYFGAEVPRYFDLLQDPATFEDAMELYWQLHPARKATGILMGEANAGTTLVHRMLWKYQGWLQGFNGGPVRAPHMRLSERQMSQLRQAALTSGLDVTDLPDEAFFKGRVS